MIVYGETAFSENYLFLIVIWQNSLTRLRLQNMSFYVPAFISFFEVLKVKLAKLKNHIKHIMCPDFIEDGCFFLCCFPCALFASRFCDDDDEPEPTNTPKRPERKKSKPGRGRRRSKATDEDSDTTDGDDEGDKEQPGEFDLEIEQPYDEEPYDEEPSEEEPDDEDEDEDEEEEKEEEEED